MIKMFEYESYTEHFNGEYITTTKVYDKDKMVPGWSGCHWDNPALIRCEQVQGEIMSDEMSDFIHEIGATDIEEEADE